MNPCPYLLYLVSGNIMKRIALIVYVVGLGGTLGCKEGAKQDHSEIISRMEDSVFKSLPTVNRVSIEITDDFGKEVVITLGDKTFYNGTDEERLKATEQAGMITLYNFRNEEQPHKGKVIFVEAENTINDGGKGKEYDMHLDELQKMSGIPLK
jgi:hypothetical protein